MAAHVYGVDLGTSNIKMFSLENNGTINEKNVIAIKNKDEIFSFGDSAFEMYRQLGRFYESHQLHMMNHSRITRYEILLEFIQSMSLAREVQYRERLTFDLYLRENVKSRPEFVGIHRVEKEELNKFYEVWIYVKYLDTFFREFFILGPLHI